MKPENKQTESFEPLKPSYSLSYASTKVNNENDGIRNWISNDFDKRRISQPFNRSITRTLHGSHCKFGACQKWEPAWLAV